jgi:Ca-activated chloride channel homolog
MKPQTRFLIAAFAVFVLFVAFAFQAPPARADGLVYVECPPIVVPLGGTPVPMPMPQPLPPSEIQPTAVALGAPPIITRIPPTRSVPPIRRDCSTYLAVQNHNVTVTIDNQVARTHVDETFFNDSAYALEGTYIFLLPDDATISDFAMWVDGKRLDGQVLNKNQARQIYEDIVRRQRDPALLEYVGRNAFQARIFPIPPQSTKRVEIEYSQVLQADNGLVRYVYPLNTEKFSPKPLASVSVNVSIKSNAALKAIYSPSHDVSVVRNGDYAATVGYEDTNVTPDRDFVLYYSVTQDQIGLNLLSYKPNGEDGFFLMLVAPKVEVDTAQVIAKDVILVLDVSGSMQGAKIAQAKNALDYVLDHLNPDDRFNIISFSTGTRAYAPSLQPVSARDDAKQFVANLRAEGSTDINRALLEAIANAGPTRPATIIFLTDGLPTTGETSAQKIIANVTNAAPKNVRLFTFGVGDDVNTFLLDSLAEKLRGASSYVRPNEKIDEIVSAFYAKVSTPVLSDISVDWGGIDVNDVYPYPLPDLFAGSQLVVAGRYRPLTGIFDNGGPTTITLKGTVNGTTQTFKYSDLSFATSGGDDGSTSLTTSFIPRLWATRKIGYLLNQIRLNGESKEVVTEIVTLAVRYGIVTPYTSFLVDDSADVLTDQGRGGAAQQLQRSLAPSAMPYTGAGAVQQSQQQNQLRGASVAPTAAPMPASPGSAEQVTPLQAIGDKTFLLRDGVWTDTEFDPSKMTTRKIEFNSDAYFALATNNSDWGKYLALGSRVIVVLNGTPYEITDNGSGASDTSAAPTAPPVSPTVESRALPASTPVVRTAQRAPEVVTPTPSAAPTIALLLGGGLLGLGVIGSVIAVVFALKRK